MDSLFLDTNILLDVIIQREPFFADSLKIWRMVETGQAEGWIAAISFNNIHYLARKLEDARKADAAMETLHKLFRTAPVDDTIIGDAIALQFKDFEDAIQYACAKQTGCPWLLTRNVADYPGSKKPQAITPKDYLRI